MIENHPFYSQFNLVKTLWLTKTYNYGNINIKIFTSDSRQVKCVTVFKKSNNKKIIKQMFFKDDNELTFILDRVPQVRFSYPKHIALPSLVNDFGNS